jgi:hypothetical protein
MTAFRCRCGVYIKPPRRMCTRCAEAMARNFNLDDLERSGVRPSIHPDPDSRWWYIAGIVLVIGGLVLLSWWLNKN